MAGAVEVRNFEVTCPVGVATAASPQVTNLVMPTREILAIRIRIPPGPNGQMGFALGAAGRNIVPTGDGTYVVASDEIIDWALSNQIDSGAWQVRMYNTGIFPHTIYLLFTCQVPDLPPEGASPLVGLDALSSS